jgi:PEGA domain
MKMIMPLVLLCTLCQAQITIPEGTKLRVRLENTLSSATAEQGQTVELSVAEPVRLGNVTVIAEGARVTGTVTEAHEKRRMGRAGKLDFSVDRVRAMDNQWVPLRYSVTKKSGESHAVRTGIITAGVAVVFWPAAPVMLLMKGKDVVVNKGVAFDVYTDSDHLMGGGGPVSQAASVAAQASLPMRFASPAPANAAPGGTASVTVTSSVAGAEIEADGAFVGDTPTTLQLSAGPHRIVVRSGDKSWERTLQVTVGGAISLNANLK